MKSTDAGYAISWKTAIDMILWLFFYIDDFGIGDETISFPCVQLKPLFPNPENFPFMDVPILCPYLCPHPIVDLKLPRP